MPYHRAASVVHWHNESVFPNHLETGHRHHPNGPAVNLCFCSFSNNAGLRKVVSSRKRGRAAPAITLTQPNPNLGGDKGKGWPDFHDADHDQIPRKKGTIPSRRGREGTAKRSVTHRQTMGNGPYWPPATWMYIIFDWIETIIDSCKVSSWKYYSPEPLSKALTTFCKGNILSSIDLMPPPPPTSNKRYGQASCHRSISRELPTIKGGPTTYGASSWKTTSIWLI